MTIGEEKVVQIHYTLKNKKGQILDSSLEREPLTYLQGFQNLIPGLEAELEGKKVGDKFDAVIAPDLAYGHRDEALVREVPLNQFEQPETIKKGVHIHIESPEGMSMAIVSNIKGNTVTLDLNHALAGETLYFSIEVMNIRKAKADEIAHGHVHGHGGHHH